MKKIEKEPYSRKEFLRTAGSAALFSALGIPFITSCDGSTTDALEGPNGSGNGNAGGDTDGITISGNQVIIDLDSTAGAPLNSSGGWLLIRDAQVLAVNVDGTVIRAFTSVCTHQGCDTSWQFSNSLFTCSCHGSQFNTSGGVVRGPAAQDLEEFNVSKDNSNVTITK
ncbi:MAG: ubiquinol-cytochrome c reductase iron-sulfur subunit [Balneolaceae bacterium]|nr:MAG: ubiquinol-cytochrome c reductase iron-sulfur subunit [Balneolaceae bacterium]